MIRTATVGDIDSMLLLLKLLFSIEDDFLFSAEKQCRGLELLLASHTAKVLVATLNNQVVGMATGQLVISTAEGSLSMLIEDVVVDNDFQGRGYGSQLLEMLGQWGESMGANRMQLLADRGNSPAFDYYLGHGWSTTSLLCLRKYYKGQSQKS